MLRSSFSAGRDGSDGEGGDPFGKNSFQGSVGSDSRFGHGGGNGKGRSQNGDDDREEPHLFGEGGLFGKSASEGRTMDDWDELEGEEPPPQWTPEQQEQQGYDYTEGAYEGKPWSSGGETVFAQPTVEDYIPGQPLQSEEGWSTVVSEKGFTAEGPTEYGGEAQSDWMPREDTGPSYVGKWGPDGRLIKVQAQLSQDVDTYPPVADDTTPDAAFGDLIRKSGYTDNDIANLMAGFYEPVGLPHLDDYKFVDMDAERRKKRREMELAKMAEMAKRWVRKVDEQGFAHGVGRRKTSSARVWIKEGQGRVVINKKHHDMYFNSMDDRAQYLEPFVVTDTVGMFDTFVLVRGGGTTGQAGAVRHGLSRALMWYDPSLRGTLKKAGMLTRDPRKVERKKPGKAKARKSFQWVKR